MKFLKVLMVLCALLLFAAPANALLINPDTVTPLAFGGETSQSEIESIIAPIITPAVELYKNDFDEDTGTGAESGSLAGSYSTEWILDDEDEAIGADITYDGGAIVDPPAYLLVKDGVKGVPAWYLFALTSLGWDGMETLELRSFWDGERVSGSISHVTLYGTTSQVPEPATMLLLGFGLVGLAGLGRKKFFKK